MFKRRLNEYRYHYSYELFFQSFFNVNVNVINIVSAFKKISSPSNFNKDYKVHHNLLNFLLKTN
jgi:hypothetical protein